MDINSRINWQPGMELNTETIRSLYGDLNAQQLTTIKAALGSSRMGLLPGAPFNNQGTFVRSTFEMSRLQCRALLPSGKVLDVNETVCIKIPVLNGDTYYVTVSFGQETVNFEHQGVPYERPGYVFAITAPEDLNDELFPVARFLVNDNTLNFDTDFIPPTLQLADDDRFSDYISRYISHLETILAHPNLDKDFARRVMLNYLFQLKGMKGRGRTNDFVILTQEIAQAADYFILSKVEPQQPQDIPEPSPYDIQKWLSWLDNFLSTATQQLEYIQCEDQTIDIEALKEEIKNDLYEKLYNALYESLRMKIKEELTEELTANLQEVLTVYINEQLKPAIIEQLREELSQSLYDSLYKALYDALINALSLMPRQVEEEDTFTPLI